MSKRDPLRPYMDVIDDMLLQMVLILHSIEFIFINFASSRNYLLSSVFFPSLEKTPVSNQVVAD